MKMRTALDLLISALVGAGLIAIVNILYYGSATRPNTIVFPNTIPSALCEINDGKPFWLSEAGCVHCAQAEAYLTRNNLTLSKISNMQVRQSFGIGSVPAIVFHDRIVIGFSPREFQRAAKTDRIECEADHHG